MRTTLSIDEDVLAAAKALAAREHKPVGEVISFLARRALTPDKRSGNKRNGIQLLNVKPDAVPVTPELIARLRDELQ
jgi:hypothetical protein